MSKSSDFQDAAFIYYLLSIIGVNILSTAYLSENSVSLSSNRCHCLPWFIIMYDFNFIKREDSSIIYFSINNTLQGYVYYTLRM